MKAVLCKAYGPPESLVIEEVEALRPGPGQVVIGVKACGVNFPDTLIIEGKYQFKPEMPFSPGGEVAGIVKELGEGVQGVKVGDRLSIKRKVREVRDPATGKVLRAIENSVGSITITEVEDTSAVGRFSGSDTAKVGDVVANQ